MPIGTEIVRALGQAGKQRALFKLEGIGGFSKVAARGHLDTPGAAAEINRVEVELENLLFAERALDPRRQDHLADLALVSRVVTNQQVLHDLLGDGRPALGVPGASEITDECA